MSSVKILAVLLAAGAGTGIGFIVSNDLGSSFEVCLNGAKPVTGFFPADFFLCFIGAFFQRVFASPDSLFSSSNIFPAFGVFSLFLFLESGRRGSTGFITFPTAVFTLGQLMGFGVLAPLLTAFFVPSPIPSNPSAKSPFSRAPSVAHSWISLLVALAPVPLIAVITLLPAESEFNFQLITLLQAITVLPVLLMLAPLFDRRQPAHSSSAPSSLHAVHLAYGILAGISMATYFSTLSTFLLRHRLVPTAAADFRLDHVLASWGGLSLHLTMCTWALVIDFIGVYGAVLLLVLRDEGMAGVARVLAISLVLSPGVGMAYAAYRRELHYEEIDLKLKSA